MNVEALKELAAKIASGTDAPFNGMQTDWINSFSQHKIDLIQNANHGSLDAAKALHDAVLPGWDWSILSGVQGDLVRVGQARETFDPKHSGVDFDDNPASAWLLAILRALIAENEK